MADPKKDSLFISDDFVFYTLEGEGRYIGYPSVFMRLSMCNLTCIGFKSEDAPFGCDSYISWSKKNKMTFEEIAEYFEKHDYHNRLREGAILKLTGGEPFIQQKNLLSFIYYIKDKWGFINYSKPMDIEELAKPKLLIDFETNGTIMPMKEWESLQVTYTTSPKMANNGDPVEKRYKPEVLKYLIKQNACFKFVAKHDHHLDELYAKYINDPEIQLPKGLIWIMPMCGSRKELLEVGPEVADICKRHGLKFSNRAHLQLWNLALKV